MHERDRFFSVFGFWVALAALVPAIALAAPVNLGTAGPDHWAMLSLGNTNVDIGSANVTGTVANVGVRNVGDCAVVKSFVGGKLVMNTAGKLSVSDSFIGGGVQQNAAGDAVLDQAAADALAAAATAAGLAANHPVTNVGNATGTITGGPGVNVLHVTNFMLTNGFNLTFDAPAGGSFVVNVHGTFHMADGSRVLLGGNLKPSDILYNIVGTGNKVDIIKAGTVATGVILSPQREIMVVKGNVHGSVISGGGKLTDHSGATIENSDCPGCPVPAEESSWGRIKSQYR